MNEEATQESVLRVAPKVTKAKAGERTQRRYSTGTIIPRSSISSSNSDDKPLPNYLRASGPSCHDRCKYGKKHDDEAKGNVPFLRKSRKKLAPAGEQIEVKVLILGEGRKRPDANPKSSSVGRDGFSDNPKVPDPKRLSVAEGTELLEKSVSSELQTPPGTQKSILSGEQALIPTPTENKSQVPSSAQNRIVSGEQAIFPTSTGNEQMQVKSLDTGDKKKRQDVKQKTTPVPKTSPDKLRVVKQKHLSPENEIDAFGKPDYVKKKTGSPVDEVIAAVKPKMANQASVKKPVSSVKRQTIKQKASMPSRSVSEPTICWKMRKAQQEQSASLTTTSGGKISKSIGITKQGEKKVLKPPIAPLPPKSATGRVSSLKPNKYGKEKFNLVKNQEVEKADLDGENKEEKTLHVVESKPKNSGLNSVQQKSDDRESPPSVAHNEEKKSEDIGSISLLQISDIHNQLSSTLGPHSMTVEAENVDLIEAEKAENLSEAEKAESIASNSVQYIANDHRSSPYISHDEEKPENIDLDTVQPISSSQQSSISVSHGEAETEDSESLYSESIESVSENEGTESNGNVDISKDEDRRRSRRAHPEDDYSTTHKLRFRRGRVLELQPENSGPRRLRFRRRRTEGESLDGQLERRSSRKKSETNVAASSDPNPENPAVVLRHQDAQGKKETQALFNNVIEETASKLSESRRSKVKALVGAFETVISLQESKPASTA